MRVRVTFYVEASDPDDHTGLTVEDHERLWDELSSHPLSNGDAPTFELEDAA